MDPLSLLSFQTINNSQFDSEAIDYDSVEVLPNTQRYLQNFPIEEVAAAPLPIESPGYTDLPSLFKTRAQVLFQSEVATSKSSARNSAEDDSKLYLASACGNCARAFGSPLVCALTGLSASPLNVCESFISPTSI